MLIPLTEYCKIHPWPKQQNLRQIIFYMEKITGAQAPFVIRYGKRVLIDVDKFKEWLKSQEGNQYKKKEAEYIKDRKTQKKTQLDMF